jgi:hypothetical protein
MLNYSVSFYPTHTHGSLSRTRKAGNPVVGYTFPCDAQGNVDADALPDKARENYELCKVMGRNRPRELHAPK